MRNHRARCIKTFAPPVGSGPTAGSESAVQDMLPSPSGNLLYSASGNFINVWDVKKSVGYYTSCSGGYFVKNVCVGLLIRVGLLVIMVLCVLWKSRTELWLLDQEID